MIMRDFSSDSFPIVVAHRGASAAYPENTLESFLAAAKAGADAVELDVRLSADGVPVVIHDSELSRVAGVPGLVHEKTAADLKRLDVSGGSGRPARIPLLAEVLEALSGRVGLDLELKNIPGEPGCDSPHEAVVEATLRALNTSSFSGPVLLSSFNWLTIERSLELAPEVPTGFLTMSGIDPWAALVYAQEAGHPWILPHVDAVLGAGPQLMEEARTSGIRVGTWVTDDESALRELFGRGVAAVASNDPALAVAVRNVVRARQETEG
jgi:glycerophosphoryl diester phosphodiesterase